MGSLQLVVGHSCSESHVTNLSEILVASGCILPPADLRGGGGPSFCLPSVHESQLPLSLVAIHLNNATSRFVLHRKQWFLITDANW